MAPRLSWDIFCQVVDNFGDIGVCWRLAADLAGRGHTVRLWVDDASALGWMAPEGCPGVEVRGWTRPIDADSLRGLAPADVWIEAFGCDVPAEFVARGSAPWRLARGRRSGSTWNICRPKPMWSAATPCPRPCATGAVAGGVKWFFYPGFTERTGGLLREPDLLARQTAFDSAAWRAAIMPALVHEPLTAKLGATPARWVSLFCYEPAALPGLLRQWNQASRAHPAAGDRGARDCRCAVGAENCPLDPAGQLSIAYLPTLTQRDYDHLLWACDLNFVRGEDSVVRAIWSGKPFVWQIYPQDDGVHLEKLDAFLDVLRAPASLRQAHHAWNAGGAIGDWPASPKTRPSGPPQSENFRQYLCRQQDLASQLLQFVLEKR
jgi:uncharacterized repeat protein (TIGR03837 family)